MVATFPTIGLDVKYELALGGTWTDVTGDVYQREDTTITRGQADESSSSVAQTSQCSFQLDNRSGNYSSRNPVGAYYGQLGRNTPFQLTLRTAYDTFTRASSSTWTTSDSGAAWSWFGQGGTVAATDVTVNGSAGLHSVPATTAYRQTTIDGAGSYADVDIQCTWSMALASITGAPVEPCNLIFRADPATGQYWIAKVSVAVGGSISLSVVHVDGTVIAGPTASGITYAANTQYRVRARMEGNTMRMKMWAVSGVEPYAWLVVGTDTTIHANVNATGVVGVRSAVQTGNTNTLPIVFTYDNFEVRSVRFSGEIPEWPASQDVTTSDRYIEITASDPLRRLSSGAPPLRSPLYRGTMAATPAPVYYWPCEDGSNSVSASNVIVPTAPLIPYSTTPKWASFSDFACSAPLPTMNKSIWATSLPGYADTGSLQVRFLLHIPAGDMSNGDPIMEWSMTGSILTWQLVYLTGGDLRLVGYDQFGSAVVVNDGVFGIDDKLVRVDMNFTQSGGNINWKYSALQVGATTGSYLTGTATGYTLGVATYIILNGDGVMSASTFGHVMFNTTIMDLFAQSNQLNAYVGEDAVARIQRLCGEEGVDLSLMIGKFASTAQPMGPQAVDTLVNLLSQCADVDMGMLTGARNCVGLLFVRSSALRNADVIVTASYAAHEFQPPFQPVSDDQRLHNDITVTRQGGGVIRLMQTTGPLSTASPANGGAGTYSQSKTVNPQYDYQLAWVAGWLLAKGTVDAERYPAVQFARESRAVVANAALSIGVLNLAPGSRVQYTNLTKLGLYDTANQTVNQVTETINRFKHRIVIVTVPERIYHTLVLDASDSRLDSDSSTTAATMTTGTTSMSVATTSGPAVLWTTNAAHFPFDVLVGGERMTVTNITGASSPQTFTVTRSVNGVVKTHGVGESVVLFDQRYIQI